VSSSIRQTACLCSRCRASAAGLEWLRRGQDRKRAERRSQQSPLLSSALRGPGTLAHRCGKEIRETAEPHIRIARRGNDSGEAKCGEFLRIAVTRRGAGVIAVAGWR